MNRGKGDDVGHIDKIQVLQEAKQYFMATSVRTKKLVDVLTNCIFIITQDKQVTSKEATDLFFHITRLFHYKDKDGTLRRLTYIAIKALSQQAENVYVVTSSLTTDVNSSRDDPAIRASALRTLCQVADSLTLKTIEPYLKRSIVDKHPVVASAALTSLIRISQTEPEVAERCEDEIREALKSDSSMVQYHALALSFELCKDDNLTTSKLISTCISQGLKSSLATCLLLRIITRHINDSQSKNNIDKQYIAYIHKCLDQKDELIIFEAANAIVTMTKDSTKAEMFRVNAVIAQLRNFLSASKSASRFASVRLLNELAATSSADIRFWSIHRIGNLCRLHLLNRRYKPGDDIIGLLDFINSNVVCAKYSCVLQCEETQQFELKQEFSLGLRKNDFVITIPQMEAENSILHCVLSFLFYIVDKNYPKTLFEDKAGTIELGPNELETKLFSCDFPIAIYT